MYEAKATLEVQDLNQDFLNMKQVLPVNEVGLSGTFNDMQTQINIIESNSVLDPVIERMPARAAMCATASKWPVEKISRSVVVSRISASMIVARFPNVTTFRRFSAGS